MAVEFGADSVRGLATSPAGRVPYSLPMRPDLVVTLGMAEALLSVAPLQPGWALDASLVQADLGGITAIPVRFGVEGEERVRVGDLEVDTRVVGMRGAGVEHRWWVRRDGVVVRSARIAGAPALRVLEGTLFAIP